jgi:hypothetical protein
LVDQLRASWNAVQGRKGGVAQVVGHSLGGLHAGGPLVLDGGHDLLAQHPGYTRAYIR